MKWFIKACAAIAVVMAMPVAAQASTISLSGKHGRAAVAGGDMELFSNELNSGAPFTIQSDGGPNYRITRSGINQQTVGAYPDLVVGRHGGFLTANDPFPLKLSAIAPHEVGTTVQSIVPQSARSARWCDFYDVFLEPNPNVSQFGHTREELQVWLNAGNRGPGNAGLIAKGVRLGGRLYDIARLQPLANHIISYIPERYSNSFDGDLLPFIEDSIKRGDAGANWYLTEIEHGFEINSGNVVGIGDDNFGVQVGSRVIGQRVW